MDAFTLQMLENEITALKNQEDGLRNQAEEIRLKRTGLEDFLTKIKQTDTADSKEDVITVVPEQPIITKRTMSLSRSSKKSKGKATRVHFSKSQIMNEIIHILSDRQEWKLVDIRKRLNDHFKLEVASSSLRYAIRTLEENNQIEKPDYGVYSLAPINMPENPIAAQS